MKTYLLTVWLLWPKVAGLQPSEIIRHVVNSVESCVEIAQYYTMTVPADGVDSIAWTCVEQWGV